MAGGGPKVPKREDAGVSGTSLLNASGGSMMVVGRNDGLGTLGVLTGAWAGAWAGVLAGVWAGVLAGVEKAAGSVSNVGTEDDDEELWEGGTAAAALGTAAAAALGTAAAAAGPPS